MNNSVKRKKKRENRKERGWHMKLREEKRKDQAWNKNNWRCLEPANWKRTIE